VSLDPERVLARAAAWIWYPPEARTVDTDEFLLIAYPEHFADPTVATRWHSDRPADEVIDDVLDAAHDLGRDSVNFFELGETTRPCDLEQRLRERGGELTETLAVLALDLTRGLPELDVPPDLEVRRITGIDDLRAADLVDVEVFGGSLPDEEALALSAARLEDENRYLALRDGTPVGSAGLTVAGDAVRLWGGGVVPAARRTGADRALLDRRLRDAAAAGATMALVKGRMETSAPVLQRAGFRSYGEVRAYRLARTGA
jgi:GNAT superfamily N-acetyltransferase